ncbi:Hypothetical protein SRAE_2000185200 [Strongyloides ratti]|uniref:Uncharacterized protein n=1 Tax=Strongyloides ratti TaxID=34506 RepID=A0A090LBU0_STRRB|nr:Hypothetical protein SRAE_2000185200 [Strongyloides ratti]CEF67187.1 Hypothetical protein SRAE_2000185200 [Strongyloides ratti]
MSSINKQAEKSGIYKIKRKTQEITITENDLNSQQQKITSAKQNDKNRDGENEIFIETGNEKTKKNRNKELKETKKDKCGHLSQNNLNSKIVNNKNNVPTKSKIKEIKNGEKKYGSKIVEISNDLLDKIKKKNDINKMSRTSTKEQTNIFQTKFPGNEFECKSDLITNDINSCEIKDNSSKILERKRSIRNEICMEIDFITKPTSDKSKILSSQYSLDRKKPIQNLRKKIHRYAMFNCKGEYEKYKKSYMFPNNKNNNWQIYDSYGNPWWSKFKAGPLSKNLNQQKNDEDLTDDSLVINTQALLQVKEKRLVYPEPQEENGFSDIFGPIKDLALCNDTQYGKTKIWWISLRNVIQMNLLTTKAKKIQLKENLPKLQKTDTFNEKDPITIVRYIKGLPKKQQIAQIMMQQFPVRG